MDNIKSNIFELYIKNFKVKNIIISQILVFLYKSKYILYTIHN